jgi:transcriptional regulator with XRE-family HTH domain
LNNTLQEYGQKIKKHRLDLGLSQTDLAQKTGFSLRTIRYWETGQRQPGIIDFMKVANVLGMISMPKEVDGEV